MTCKKPYSSFTRYWPESSALGNAADFCLATLPRPDDSGQYINE